MSAIIIKYIADHKLSKDMSDEKLSQHVPALLELLTDKLKRDKGRQRFQKGYDFSQEQAFILVPDQRICQNRSQVSSQMGGSEADNLSEKDVESIAKVLTESASNDSAGSLGSEKSCEPSMFQKK